ncbi:hypothetical protein ABIB37_001504 [Agrococcus sp. UYP10]|uniref:hypothetical protein n=1 Tax=Agrococcus sp. UYP10 TaxID=1756355 RepID=UPI003397A71D
MPWVDASQTVKVLAILARSRPEVYDVFPPHRLAAEPSAADRLVVEGISMARRVAQLAIEADVRGEDPVGWLSQLIDEWCGTPWPGKWPRPGSGPAPEEGPHPEPWALNGARIAGAAVFASTAWRLGDGPLRAALIDGAERLAEIAVRE